MLCPSFAILLLASQIPKDAMAHLPEFIASPAARAVVLRHLDEATTAAFPGDPKLRAEVVANVASNLADKRALYAVDGKPFTLSVDEVKRTVVDYEVFKLKTYLAAGVFPKRYFGYFDEKWDTAAREKTLRRLVGLAVKTINDFQARAKSTVRITDAEVAVTFIAEGGALLLRERQDKLNDNIHPVGDVGLDDLAKGLVRRKELTMALLKATGVRFSDTIEYLDGGGYVLRRPMNFEEAILGTALMWIDEKLLADDALHKAEGRAISDLSVDEQFVATSLVYNSGLVFAPESRALIVGLATGAEMHRVSLANEKARWLLPVLPPLEAAEAIRLKKGYPVQNTSWSAMYHVLQRYGAYRALQACTDVFDNKGMFRAAR